MADTVTVDEPPLQVIAVAPDEATNCVGCVIVTVVTNSFITYVVFRRVDGLTNRYTNGIQIQMGNIRM